MPHYITQVELVALFPGAFESVTTDLWVQVLDGVDGFINGKLSKVYSVPVEPVPALLKEIATDLARYQLEDSLIYDEVKDDGLKVRYDYALKQINEIANGTLTLDGVAQLQSGAGASGVPVFSAPDRVFTTDSLEDY